VKLRVRLAKQHLAKFHSHLDLQRTMERVLRRAGLPLAYSQGFSPHPKMSFGSALATGTSSEGEFVDIELSEPMEPEVFVARANHFCPPGLMLVEARVAPEKGDSLFSLLDVAEYRLTVKVPGSGAGAVAEAVAAFLARDVVDLEKETKRGTRRVNIREQVYSLAVEGLLPDPGGDAVLVNLRVQAQSGSQGNLKPEVLLEGLQAVAEPSLATAELVGAHRLMLFRRDPESGALLEPWGL
jgi:radical SAM-linked protein